MKTKSFDLMGIVAPIAGYFMFGWRGALLAFLLKSEIKFRF